MYESIELRPLQRQAYCRGCNRVMEKEQITVYTYSPRNRGQHIYFCMDCAKQIGELYQEWSNEPERI